MMVRQAVGCLSLDEAPQNARLGVEPITNNDLKVRSATRGPIRHCPFRHPGQGHFGPDPSRNRVLAAGTSLPDFSSAFSWFRKPSCNAAAPVQ